MNTDDPVPSTNSPLKNAACYDVTGSSRRDQDVDGHSWPLVWFARHAPNVGFVPEGERGEIKL